MFLSIKKKDETGSLVDTERKLQMNLYFDEDINAVVMDLPCNFVIRSEQNIINIAKGSNICVAETIHLNPEIKTYNNTLAKTVKDLSIGYIKGEPGGV